jgi:DNA-binding MarR family transcriptional regulator
MVRADRLLTNELVQQRRGVNRLESNHLLSDHQPCIADPTAETGDEKGFLPKLGAERLDLLLCRAGMAVSRAAEAEADRHGLAFSQHLVLKMLAAVGPVSQQELSEGLRIDRSCMVTCIDGLEAGGLVRRNRNPTDRRAYAVAITDAGIEALAEADRDLPDYLDRVFRTLSAAERVQLSALLKKLLCGG